MNFLRLKSLVVGTAFEPAAHALREAQALAANISHPELGLLRAEAGLMDKSLARLLTPEDNCLDVGAHIGSFCAKFQRLAPEGRHFAIEASPSKAQWLKKKFPKIAVINSAVSDAAGEATFYENQAKPGFSGLTKRAGDEATLKEVKVPLARIDDLIPQDADIQFIKIDIEGFEYPAVRGAGTLLRRCRPVVLFEAGPLLDEIEFGFDWRGLFNHLTAMDYEIFAIFDWHFGRPKLSAPVFDDCRIYPFRAFNFFALPAEKVAMLTERKKS